MKYFKMEPSRMADRHVITREEYKNVTELQYPFGQLTESPGSAKSYYAVCPECLNPIQIVGLGEKSKVNPYGKHAGKSIQGVAKWNYKEYVTCSYADPSIRIDPTGDFEKAEIDQDAVELYNLMRDYFDLVVLTIADALQIKASASYWRKCLKVFVSDREYAYPWLTDSNMPYIFALLGMMYSGLFNLQFKSGSGICKALEGIPNIVLSDPDQYGYRKWVKSNCFTILQFRFLDHKRYAKNGEELKESIRVFVDEIKDGKSYNRYEHTLMFDETGFERRRRHVKKRQQWLLDIAKEEMPDIEPNI